MNKRNNLSIERGQALVEMAFIFLLFLLLVFVILDLGRAVYYYSVVYNASREGARSGIIPESYNEPFTRSNLDLDSIDVAVRQRAVGVNIIFNKDDIADINVNTLSYPYKLRVRVRTTFTPVTPLISNITGGDIVITSTTTMNVEK